MTTDRRLIEEALPLEAVSAESGREKRHISALHVWWARLPLAACRAAICASLVPDPGDEAEREKLLGELAELCKWENSNKQELLERAGKRIRDTFGGRAPKVLDCFAGGGAIPLEALRLGCEVYALDLSPVATLILLCTIVYPQKFGKALRRKVRTESGMEVEEEVNPLAEDVRRWGQWVLEEARKELASYYPNDPDGRVPVAYLWARTVRCPNPDCGAEMPLIRQYWLANKDNKKVAAKPIVDKAGKRVSFDVVEGDAIDFEPTAATTRRGDAVCLVCQPVGTAPVEYVRGEGRAGRLGQIPLAVVLNTPAGKRYRPAAHADIEAYQLAARALGELRESNRADEVPTEPLPPVGTLGFRVNNYGLDTWDKLFNPRQLLALTTFVRLVRQAHERLLAEGEDPEYARAVATYLALGVDRLAEHGSAVCSWHVGNEQIRNTFSRQAIPMVWDYAETNPIGGSTGSWASVFADVPRIIGLAADVRRDPATVTAGTVSRLQFATALFDAVVTDPPYYDNVPYADLSDFFYVWLKRSAGKLYPDILSGYLTPKGLEIVQNPAQRVDGGTKDKAFYEAKMTEAFREMHRVLKPEGIAVVVFAHKSTAAWETLIGSMLRAGFAVTSSWPLEMAMRSRLRAQESAALASYVLLVCRKRHDHREGVFEDVRQEMRARIRQKLDQFWKAGISGADFFISAIGPGLEPFSRYDRVLRLSGEEVTVERFLEEVHQVVQDYVLEQVIKERLGQIDPPSRFYVLWRWSYGRNKVPFDDARLMAQALGAEVSELMGRGRLLEQQGENVTLRGPLDQSREEHLGEPVGGRLPPLIDVVHRAALLWEAGSQTLLAQFLGSLGTARLEAVRTVANAIANILSEGDKERQLMQGLLGARGVAEARERAREVAQQARLPLEEEPEV